MNISFLNPAFLFALPLASVPIIIHLLTRKKYKTYPFSETKFIQTALKKTVRRHKLREYLLLFVRCLIVLVLTLLFSRPVVHSGRLFDKPEELGKSLFFLLDNSYSLGYFEDGQPRFNLVKEVGENLINKLDEFDEIAVGSFSNRLNILTKNFIQDKKTCLGIIDQIPLSTYSTDLSVVLKDVYLVLKNTKKKEKIIVLISDLAKNGWQNIGKDYFEKINFYDPEVKIVLLDVTKEISKNCAIEEIYLREVGPSKPTIVETQVANYGKEELKELPIRMYLTEKKEEKKVLNGFIEISPDEKRSKQFVYNFPKNMEDFIPGYMELEKDNLFLDNRRYFVYPRWEKVKILALDSSGGFSPTESELYYFRLSLNPYHEEGLISVDITQNGEWIKKLTPAYSLLVLANWEDVSQEENERLKSYLRDGGNIFLSLGDKVDLEFYNQDLDWLIPAELVKVKSEKVKISHFAAEHPALKIFSQDTDPLRRDTSEASFSTIMFSTYCVVEPKPASKILLRLTDGNPLLLESQPYPGQNGKVFLYTSTLNRKWNNFPAKPLYPTLFQELVRYLTRKEEKILSFNSGEDILIPFPEKLEEFKIHNWGDNSKPVELIWKEEKEFRGYKIKDSLEPGFYPFSYQIKGKKDNGFLLVNFDSANGESNLRQVDYSEIKNLFFRSPVTYISVKEKYPEKFVQFLKGKEISQNLVILTFLFLVAEGILANRSLFGKKKTDEKQ
jgi:hypothetical protein